MGCEWVVGGGIYRLSLNIPHLLYMYFVCLSISSTDIYKHMPSRLCLACRHALYLSCPMWSFHAMPQWGDGFHILRTIVRQFQSQLLLLPNSPSTSPSPHHHLSLIWAFSDPDYPNPPGRFQNQVIMKDSLHYGIILETPLFLFEALL